MDENLLKELLIRMFSGGGAALVAYWFLSTPAGEKLREWTVAALRWLAVNPQQAMRILAVVLATAVALACYAVAGGFGFVAFPATFAGWVNLVLALGGLAFTGSQGLHTVRDLGKESNG